MLIRLFRGVIRDGAHDRLMRKLHGQVLPSLEADPAVLSATLALPLDSEVPREFLLETRWTGIGELIRFAGEDWRTPHLEPAEEECIVSVSAHHYVMDRVVPLATADAGPMPMEVWLGGVGIDGRRLEVAWDGSAIHLPRREMAAMLALASRPGTPVRTNELARRIWPGSALVGPYDVRRVIHRLRTLVGSTDVPIAIRNVHGEGYLVEPQG